MLYLSRCKSITGSVLFTASEYCDGEKGVPRERRSRGGSLSGLGAAAELLGRGVKAGKARGISRLSLCNKHVHRLVVPGGQQPERGSSRRLSRNCRRRVDRG